MEDVRHKWHCFPPPSPKAIPFSLPGLSHTITSFYMQQCWQQLPSERVLPPMYVIGYLAPPTCTSPNKLSLYYKHSSTIVKQHAMIVQPKKSLHGIFRKSMQSHANCQRLTLSTIEVCVTIFEHCPTKCKINAFNSLIWQAILEQLLLQNTSF